MTDFDTDTTIDLTGVDPSHLGVDPAVRTGDQKMLLQIYLNDHRAGAAGGLALVRRSRDSNQGTSLGDTLAALAVEIEDDAATLDRIAEHLGLRPNPVKQLAVQVAERVGRLKLNGRLRGYSPLSRVLELEGLLAGIDAKRKLWMALRAMVADGQIGGIDLCELSERAESQRERLISHHHEAVVEAFGGPPT
jgi:hypothetical protein